MDMELDLFRAFQQAWLPAPRMLIEVPVGEGPEIARWVHDLFCSLRPRMAAAELEPLGDLESLRVRLDAELAGARSFGACIGLVGTWSRKP